MIDDIADLLWKMCRYRKQYEEKCKSFKDYIDKGVSVNKNNSYCIAVETARLLSLKTTMEIKKKERCVEFLLLITVCVTQKTTWVSFFLHHVVARDQT